MLTFTSREITCLKPMPSWLRCRKARLKLMPSGSKVNSNSFVQCYLPLILIFPYISSSSGSPALSPLANLPNPSSLHLSLFLQSGWISSFPTSLCSFPTAENSQLSQEHKEAQSRLNQTLHMKISLTLQADDFKKHLNEKSKVLGNTNCL